MLELSINMAFDEIRHRARLVKDYGDAPPVEADDARLGQVFLNLLVNAAQALSDGGAGAHEIRVVTSTDAEGKAVVEVRDTGPGIAPEALERIFDPFFTTRPVGVGTGLGLSICHNIVTGMGGEITVASRPGHGTTFRVVLPAASGVLRDAPGDRLADRVPPGATRGGAGGGRRARGGRDARPGAAPARRDGHRERPGRGPAGGLGAEKPFNPSEVRTLVERFVR